ncbi:MAG TPA: cache domain-containing protein, partial [Anaerolineales bacterium]|nr:cache domain-containing protein [Anaerolineales bacterium]
MSGIEIRMNEMTERQRQIALWLAGVLTIAGLAQFVFSSYIIFALQNGEMDISDRFLFPATGLMFLANLIGFFLIRQSTALRGTWLVFTFSLVIIPVMATLVLKNTFLVTAVSTALFGYAFRRFIFPESEGRRALVTICAAIFVILGIELWNPAFRVESTFNAPAFGAGVMTLAGLGLIIYFIRRAVLGSVRTKVVAGILFTGGVSIAVVSFFAINRAAQLVETLSGRVETSVNLLAEEQLISTVSTESNRADIAFNATVSQVQSLANELELLQAQKDKLGIGTYWNASEELIRLGGGQHANFLGKPSSVFVPSTVTLDDSVYQELNTNSYLDFSAPFVLENNRQIRAVYYTNLDGVIIYFPNVNLAANVPHDYDATKQPTFRVATPLLDPQREPRWSFPRQDPAGVGLIVSVSMPVYFDDEFSGVMSADFRLNSIAQEIASISIGQTGYAFLVDNNGLIIAMPPEGYETFGLQPEVLEVNEEPKLTIFDGDAPFEMQQITRRMVVGGTGIITTKIGDADVFIAYAPVANRNFSLGVIVPVEELTQPIAATRGETNLQIQLAIRNAAIILVALLAGAIIVSLGLGQVIAAPVQRLTQTANQILEGDLAAQAEVTTRDEIGTLAQAFNAMTARLRETFDGLEKNIEERTAQLVEANAKNERRAKQFQSIAQVARTISSTLDLESLLDQITTVISREFGFYHVGVFLLDTAGEYAVLSAANSKGGQIMLARGHRLRVGEKGLVGFVSSTGRARVALDTGADAIFFNNPDLPDTRSEIALPMRAGAQIIGVLDVQSLEQNAFAQEDVAILT